MFLAASRFVLSLLAAFAVLLGALEHEDLILQESPPDAAASPLNETVSTADADRGTEGTFRLHLFRFWLSPPTTDSKPLYSITGRVAPPAPVIQDRRAALARHVALRL